jgi:hypothetical protein
MNKKMKTTIKITTVIALLLGAVSLVSAQDANMSSSDLDEAINTYMQSKQVDGAELGMVLCEDAQGNKVICSGSIEESVLGVVTSVPYLTVNKPASSRDSRFIFDAMVSSENGQISSGDYLKAVSGGKFGKCTKEEIPFAYAIALEDANGKENIRIKILK